jgi:hypothetical protein
MLPRLWYLWKGISTRLQSFLCCIWRRFCSWLYNYLCNQCLSPLTLWVWIPLMARCTLYNIMWWSLSVTCHRSWFSPGTLASSTNKTDDIAEILLKVVKQKVYCLKNTHYLCVHKLNGVRPAISGRFGFLVWYIWQQNLSHY